jgi:hypothetical protein
MKLCALEGYKRLNDLLKASVTDSICPAICITQGCDYTSEMEPDQDAGLLRSVRRQYRHIGAGTSRPDIGGHIPTRDVPGPAPRTIIVTLCAPEIDPLTAVFCAAVVVLELHGHHLAHGGVQAEHSATDLRLSDAQLAPLYQRDYFLREVALNLDAPTARLSCRESQQSVFQ